MFRRVIDGVAVVAAASAFGLLAAIALPAAMTPASHQAPLATNSAAVPGWVIGCKLCGGGGGGSTDGTRGPATEILCDTYIDWANQMMFVVLEMPQAQYR